MNIAFCDDNEVLLDVLTALVKELINKHNIYNFQFNYFRYSDPALLLEEHKILNFDIAFLDVEMCINGLNIGDEIYATNNDVFIFYVTSYKQYLAESIKHRVYRFVQKGDKNELESGIESMLNDMVLRNSNYVFSYRKNDYILPMSSINYFECKRNYVKIVTSSGTYTQRITIKELTKSLPDVFRRCHSAFIVNVNKISQICSDHIVLFNGTELPLSRTYCMEIFQKLYGIK